MKIREDDKFAEDMLLGAQRLLRALRRAFDAREAEQVVERAKELQHQLDQIVDWIEEED